MIRQRASTIGVAAACLGLWWSVARTRWADAHSIPSPVAVAATAARELVSRGIWNDLGATMTRVVLGVAIATAVGTTLGVVLASKRRVWFATEATIEFVRSVPPILAYPLFLLALGYGEAARVAAIVFGTTGLVLIEVARALMRAPRARAESVAMAGLGTLDAVRCLHVFEILPAVFTGVRLAFTAALVISIVTEMLVGAPNGLGSRAQNALLEYRADVLWLVILLAGSASALFASVLGTIERRVVDWTDE
jgi:ABC-type nitrate/sulfonate/bicarbonate transport system permease component